MVRRRYGAGVDIALISCYMQKIASAALFPIPGLARQKEDENSDQDTDRWVSVGHHLCNTHINNAPCRIATVFDRLNRAIRTICQQEGESPPTKRLSPHGTFAEGSSFLPNRMMVGYRKAPQHL